MNMARDAYTPFGFPTQPSSCTTNWVMSLVFAFPLLFTSLVRIPGRCTRCTLINNSLGRMPVFQWTEYLYVAILPLMTVCFYCNKFGVHPDYEALDKAGKNKCSLSLWLEKRSSRDLTQCLHKLSSGDWGAYQLSCYRGEVLVERRQVSGTGQTHAFLQSEVKMCNRLDTPGTSDRMPVHSSLERGKGK